MTAWIGNVLILFAVWRLGSKHRDAWLWSIVGNMFWTYYGIQNGIWSIVFIDGIMAAVAFRNWRKWA
jgi:hypothetical protein